MSCQVSRCGQGRFRCQVAVLELVYPIVRNEESNPIPMALNTGLTSGWGVIHSGTPESGHCMVLLCGSPHAASTPKRGGYSRRIAENVQT